MIRVAGYPDYSAMAKIHSASFVKGWSAEAIRDMLATPGTKGFVYDVEGVRGMAIIRMAADECEIITIAVLESYRQKGMGRKLLDYIETYAHRDAIKTLFLEVAEDNLAARALYEKAGFETYNTRKGYYERWHGRRVDALLMRKTL